MYVLRQNNIIITKKVYNDDFTRLFYYFKGMDKKILTILSFNLEED